jgi:hypothetical protein
MLPKKSFRHIEGRFRVSLKDIHDALDQKSYSDWAKRWLERFDMQSPRHYVECKPDGGGKGTIYWVTLPEAVIIVQATQSMDKRGRNELVEQLRMHDALEKQKISSTLPTQRDEALTQLEKEVCSMRENMEVLGVCEEAVERYWLERKTEVLTEVLTEFSDLTKDKIQRVLEIQKSLDAESEADLL